MNFNMEEFGKVALIFIAVVAVIGILYATVPVFQNGVNGLIDGFINSVDVPSFEG